MTVNLEKMLLMLNNVFTLPRSYRSMEGLRTAASDYISQKLGNLGLIVGIQYFFPSRFYHQVIFPVSRGRVLIEVGRWHLFLFGGSSGV